MSPSVERTEFNGNIGQVPVIKVSLADSEPFNPDKFDKLVKESTQPEPELGMYFLKYIVYAGIMYIFPARLLHDTAHFLFVANGVTDRPQSAGTVGINLDDPDDHSRTIGDYSVNLSIRDPLSNKAILTKGDSDTYKFTVIREKLGDFFKVT